VFNGIPRSYLWSDSCVSGVGRVCDEMTLFAIDVPRMFGAGDDGNSAARLMLLAWPSVPPMIWLDRFITILSGR
jgi:hypothetical protein